METPMMMRDEKRRISMVEVVVDEEVWAEEGIVEKARDRCKVQTEFQRGRFILQPLRDFFGRQVAESPSA